MSLLDLLTEWRAKRANPRSLPADLVYDATKPLAQAVDAQGKRLAEIERHLGIKSRQPGPTGSA